MDERALRRRGARIGAYPGLALVVLSLMSGAGFEPQAVALWIGPVAIPVGAFLGWWHAPRVAAAAHLPLGRLLLLAAEAVLAGLALISVIGGISTAVWSPEFTGASGFAAGAAFVAFFGLLIFGLPMLGVTFVCAVAWAWWLRRGSAT